MGSTDTSRVFYSDSHISQLTRSLYELNKNTIGCDVWLESGNGTKHVAHSTVLSAASKYLQRVLMAKKNVSVTEEESKKQDHVSKAGEQYHVSVEGILDESMKCLVKFIYTGELLLTEGSVKSIYQKCIEWELGEGIKICHKFLQTLPREYVTDTLGLAEALETLDEDPFSGPVPGIQNTVDDLIQRHATLMFFPKSDDGVIRENVQEAVKSIYENESNRFKDSVELSDGLEENCDDHTSETSHFIKHSATKHHEKCDFKKKTIQSFSRKWNKRATKALIPWLEKDNIEVIPSLNPPQTSTSLTENLFHSSDRSCLQEEINTNINTGNSPSIPSSAGTEDEQLVLVPNKTKRGRQPKKKYVQVEDTLMADERNENLGATGIRSRLRQRSAKGIMNKEKGFSGDTNIASVSDTGQAGTRHLPTKQAQTANQPIENGTYKQPKESGSGLESISDNSLSMNYTKNSVMASKRVLSDIEGDLISSSDSDEKNLPPKKRSKHTRFTQSSEEGPSRCPFCMKEFKYKASFEKHTPVCKKERAKEIANACEDSNICKHCEESFASPDLLTSHLVLHEKPFVCDQCEYRTRRQARLAEHKYRKHGFPLENAGLEIFACKATDCNFKTVHASVMLAHQKTKHSEKRPFMCETCGASMKSLMGLRQHKRIHSAKHDLFKCEECEAQYKSKSALEIHVKSRHKNVVDFLCSHCPYGTVSKNTLQSHMLAAHGIVPEGKTVYKCEHCGWQTIIKHLMNKHLTRHQGDRTFECEICHHKFVLAGDLKAHMKRHDSETPKKRCPFPGCKYSDFGNHKLQQHIRINHTEKGIKPWECHLCDYASAIKGNLTKHLRSVHRLAVLTNQKRLTKFKSNGSEEKEDSSDQKIGEAEEGRAKTTVNDKESEPEKEGPSKLKKKDRNKEEKGVVNVNELRRKNQMTELACTDGFTAEREYQHNPSGGVQVPQPLPSVVIHHQNTPPLIPLPMSHSNPATTSSYHPSSLGMTMPSILNSINQSVNSSAAMYVNMAGSGMPGDKLSSICPQPVSSLSPVEYSVANPSINLSLPTVSSLSSSQLSALCLTSLPVTSLVSEGSGFVLPSDASLSRHTHRSPPAILAHTVPQVCVSSLGITHPASLPVSFGHNYPGGGFLPPVTPNQPSLAQPDPQEDMYMDILVSALDPPAHSTK